MQVDVNEISIREAYHWMVGLITPRPIAWVSTQSQSGICNLAPFSFFNGVGANPPTLMFCPANQRDGSPKDTLANIRESGEFVVNLVTESDSEAMNRTAANFAPDEDEFILADLDKAKCCVVTPPRVANAAAAFECKLHSAIALGTGPGGANLVVGEIVQFYVDDQFVNDDMQLKTDSLFTLGRMGGTSYVRTTDRFDLARPKTSERKQS